MQSPQPGLVVASAMAALLCNVALADTPARPSGYSKVAGKQSEYRFVMLVGNCLRTEHFIEVTEGVESAGETIAADPRMQEPRYRACREQTISGARYASSSNGARRVPIREWHRAENQRVRRAGGEHDVDGYPYSGLYRNDGSREPLWVIDWHAAVEVDDDGRHLVRRGPWGGPMAVAFYDRGELLRSYDVTELVSDMDKLSYSVSHYIWIDKWEFLAHADRLHLRTLAGDTHVFDILTGNIVHSDLWQPPHISALVASPDTTTPQLLREVRLCGADHLLKRVMARGANANWQLFATRRHTRSGENSQTFETVSLELAGVAELMRREPRTEDERELAEGTWFRMQVRDGSLHVVALAHGLALCGESADGTPREFDFASVTHVRFCAPRDSSICGPP